ncbi:hypothetical protein NIES4075_04360 [Tolypothrix sp. NIES-4075]|uniref:hypothetical protein n=1 Tax=Tolypothrix sp. NIES-4075 TaxID=2005459 RepID=UPI000B5C729B|nr:hypothetical protein [Tolypothrix sp. NIES-4075]GAX39480.1 hypothetical protein NIES4075_04360 [Tolypothrix sp. NIES-4075]
MKIIRQRFCLSFTNGAIALAEPLVRVASPTGEEKPLQRRIAINNLQGNFQGTNYLSRGLKPAEVWLTPAIFSSI